MSDKTPGQICYEAYQVAQKKSIPHLLDVLWELWFPEYQKCWEAAATAARADLVEENERLRSESIEIENDGIVGWKIVKSYEDGSCLLESPTGQRRRYQFLDKQSEALMSENERLKVKIAVMEVELRFAEQYVASDQSGTEF